MSDLYDTDFHEWAETQAALLRRRAANMLDWDNLTEEFESLAKSDEREVASRRGKEFSMRLRPYRTVEDRIDGTVVTFVDVSERARA